MESTPLSLLRQMRGDVKTGAWNRFVYLYTPLIDRWASRLGVQDADRQDLVQEVLLTLLRALPTFEHNGHGSFRAWLHVVAHNKWKDFSRRRVPAPLADSDHRWAALAADGSQVEFEEDEYRRSIAGQALHLIKAEFQPATWKAFWATVVDGRPTDEVARELGLTPNAVYLARGRILRRLRGELSELLE